MLFHLRFLHCFYTDLNKRNYLHQKEDLVASITKRLFSFNFSSKLRPRFRKKEQEASTNPHRRKMAEMTREEFRRFLSYRTFTGKLATVRKNGSPHVVSIWFVLDEDSPDDIILNPITNHF